MSKLKDQASAIFVTVLLMGGLLAGYAYYVSTQVLPAQQRAMDALREANAVALEPVSYTHLTLPTIYSV